MLILAVLHTHIFHEYWCCFYASFWCFVYFVCWWCFECPSPFTWRHWIVTYFQVLRFRVRVHKDFICICLHFISVNVIVVHGLYAWVKRLRRKKKMNTTNVASWVGHFRTQIYTVIALVNISSKVFSFGQCFFIIRPIYGSHLFHYLF